MLKNATLKFLKELSGNNDKSWFDLHRKEYERAKEDFCQMVDEVIAGLAKIDPSITDQEAKKCMFRINRDIRFSKDKSPYKTNFGASIKSGGRKSGLAGYYIHVEPGKSFVGGGIWMPEPIRIKQIRQEIDYNGDEFDAILAEKPFRSVYKDLYEGEDILLSRLPQGFDRDHPHEKYLRMKSWLATRDVSDKELTGPGLSKQFIKDLSALIPLNRFINRTMGI